MAIRGYLVQTLIALLEALDDEPAWKSVTLEPNVDSEKVDILLQSQDSTRAVQVKSSRQPFSKANVQEWAEDLQQWRKADGYELILVGTPASGSVARIRTVGTVTVPPPKNLDLRSFMEQAAHRLDRLLELHNLPRGNADYREMLAGSLANKLETFATEGRPLVRDELIELLDRWIPQAREQALITPKGLLPYDAKDGAFFLKLLPPPLDRGLPRCVRFWKDRIEERDPDSTFRVGLLFGPSGCGKSSLAKAGLIPHLQESVVSVYVESTPDDTETRLLRALRKQLPDLQEDTGVEEALRWVAESREGSADRKVLVVLDQFEQWLHAHRLEQNTALVRALQACDGTRLQCLLMIRVEFQMAAFRLADHMKLDLRTDRNMKPVDLFDSLHARRVLAEFGRSYGRLPENLDAFSDDQNQFLDKVVVSLADEDGRIVAVRLTLFAEMVKGRPWTLEMLRQVGGVGGIGAAFLAEKFSKPNSEYRPFEKQTMAVLTALLPEAGSYIKGEMHLETELQALANCSTIEFTRLMEILVGELKLVTPAAPEETDEDSPASLDLHGKYYQLTHDYLVPSVRDWLNRKLQQNWRGHAQLRLEERTAQWTRTSERRFLPGPVEYLLILLGVSWTRFGDRQRSMMRAASRFYLLWCSAISAVVMILAIGAFGQWNNTQKQRTDTLVRALLTTEPGSVPYALDDLRPFRRRVVPLLWAVFKEPKTPRAKLHAAFGLADVDSVDQRFLMDSVASGPAGQCANIVRALRCAKDSPLAEIERRIKSARTTEEKVRFASVALHLGDEKPVQGLLALDEDPSDRTAFVLRYSKWHGDLKEVAAMLQTFKTDPQLAEFRSGLCAAVGLVSWDEISEPTQKTLYDALIQLHAEAPDGGSHGAATFGLAKWGKNIPSYPKTKGPPDDRGWFVNRQGMTMIKIPAGTFTNQRKGVKRYANIDESIVFQAFYLSDCEVTVDLFVKFFNEVGNDSKATEEEKAIAARWKSDIVEEVSPKGDCPVQEVDWFQAVAFCNWLSRSEDLTPCYALTESETNSGTWQCDLDPKASGYRLPTELEWEYACCAGSETVFSFGDDQTLLDGYGYFILNSDRTWPGESKLPNGWGLFAMHGNVWEWCQDWYDGESYGGPRSPFEPPKATERVFRGGGWNDRSFECRSTLRGSRVPSSGLNSLGFRVAAVSPRKSKQEQAK